MWRSESYDDGSRASTVRKASHCELLTPGIGEPLSAPFPFPFPIPIPFPSSLRFPSSFWIVMGNGDVAFALCPVIALIKSGSKPPPCVGELAGICPGGTPINAESVGAILPTEIGAALPLVRGGGAGDGVQVDAFAHLWHGSSLP